MGLPSIARDVVLLSGGTTARPGHRSWPGRRSPLFSGLSRVGLPALVLQIFLAAVWGAPGELPKFPPDDPAWNRADLEGPLSAEETRVFLRELSRYAFDHHLKKSGPQRGMLYEYYCPARHGQPEQYVQGEALDTMHDGAWMAAALATAYRVTGEEHYREFLTRWVLPFYLKMLNHSDTLFDASRNDARPDARPWGKEWKLLPGEKGFVPYFWDDGGSVSMERRIDKNPLGIVPCADRLAGRPNPQFLLDGYSLGSSNHLAQDLGVMLQVAWLLLRQSPEAELRALAAETAEAARNLHQSRMRHHGPIPMVVAPAALASGDAKLLGQLPPPDGPRYWSPAGLYVRALYDVAAGATAHTPGFADDQQYNYYHGIARSGGTVPQGLAFRTAYDALTNLLPYRAYSDDARVPAGINRFDLHPIGFKEGKPVDYRSDRRGPWKQPRPIGSRMGPQNMIVCGWALEMLRAEPGVWDEPFRRHLAEDLRVFIHDPPPRTKDPGPRPVGVALGPARLELWSTRDELCLAGQFSGESLELKLFARPGGQGTHAVVRLAAARPVAAVNDRGEDLLVRCDEEPRRLDGSTRFRLRVPYTVVKGQRPWANGIEFGRYSVAVGNDRRDFALASPQPQVAAWLEHELGAGLRTWRAIFRHCGYIPTGLGTHSVPLGPGWTWDAFSDNGGYAHLIAAGAQWLLCLQGKRDWELHGIKDIVPSANQP